jgi:hypothetical protein
VLRKVIIWTTVIFAVYYLATNPHGAAGFVRGVFHGLQYAGNSLSSFLSDL